MAATDQLDSFAAWLEDGDVPRDGMPAGGSDAATLVSHEPAGAGTPPADLPPALALLPHLHASSTVDPDALERKLRMAVSAAFPDVDSVRKAVCALIAAGHAVPDDLRPALWLTLLGLAGATHRPTYRGCRVNEQHTSLALSDAAAICKAVPRAPAASALPAAVGTVDDGRDDASKVEAVAQALVFFARRLSIPYPPGMAPLLHVLLAAGLPLPAASDALSALCAGSARRACVWPDWPANHGCARAHQLLRCLLQYHDPRLATTADALLPVWFAPPEAGGIVPTALLMGLGASLLRPAAAVGVWDCALAVGDSSFAWFFAAALFMEQRAALLACRTRAELSAEGQAMQRRWATRDGRTACARTLALARLLARLTPAAFRTQARGVARCWSQASPATMRQRLARYYAQHNPGNVGAVDELLERFRGEEEELQRQVRDKYGGTLCLTTREQLWERVGTSPGMQLPAAAEGGASGSESGSGGSSGGSVGGSGAASGRERSGSSSSSTSAGQADVLGAFLREPDDLHAASAQRSELVTPGSASLDPAALFDPVQVPAEERLAACLRWAPAALVRAAVASVGASDDPPDAPRTDTLSPDLMALHAQLAALLPGLPPPPAAAAAAPPAAPSTPAAATLGADADDATAALWCEGLALRAATDADGAEATLLPELAPGCTLPLFVIDCRPRRMADAGRFSTAFQVDPRSINDADVLTGLLDTLAPMRGALHFVVQYCLPAGVRPGSEADVTAAAAADALAMHLQKRGVPWVGVVRGGFDACHTVLRDAGRLGQLVDHAPSVCHACKLERLQELREKDPRLYTAVLAAAREQSEEARSVQPPLARMAHAVALALGSNVVEAGAGQQQQQQQQQGGGGGGSGASLGAKLAAGWRQHAAGQASGSDGPTPDDSSAHRAVAASRKLFSQMRASLTSGVDLIRRASQNDARLQHPRRQPPPARRATPPRKPAPPRPQAPPVASPDVLAAALARAGDARAEEEAAGSEEEVDVFAELLPGVDAVLLAPPPPPVRTPAAAEPAAANASSPTSDLLSLSPSHPQSQPQSQPQSPSQPQSQPSSQPQSLSMSPARQHSPTGLDEFESFLSMSSPLPAASPAAVAATASASSAAAAIAAAVAAEAPAASLFVVDDDEEELDLDALLAE